MTEEKINAFRQTDTNLRNALRMDEAERPQMPADLNERLMQRMAVKEDKQPRRIVWPWIAAACVAGIMVIWLMPPKATTTDVVAENKVIEQPTHIDKEEESPEVKEETEATAPVVTPVKTRVAKLKTKVVKREAALLAQDTKTAQTPAAEEVNTELAVAETAKPQEKVVTLTERDIPITRPENYQYTPEEIALLKKQANEAYLKWAELELEISKYNLEQASSK
jgi:outer membrane biosynthesis protein TonB